MSKILLNAIAGCKTEKEMSQVWDLAKETKSTKEEK
jgi:hypothetical protein